MAREFINTLRARGCGAADLIEGRSAAEWLDWADARVSAMDATRHGPEKLFEDVVGVTTWSYRL